MSTGKVAGRWVAGRHYELDLSCELFQFDGIFFVVVVRYVIRLFFTSKHRITVTYFHQCLAWFFVRIVSKRVFLFENFKINLDTLHKRLCDGQVIVGFTCLNFSYNSIFLLPCKLVEFFSIVATKKSILNQEPRYGRMLENYAVTVNVQVN